MEQIWCLRFAFLLLRLLPKPSSVFLAGIYFLPNLFLHMDSRPSLGPSRVEVRISKNLCNFFSGTPIALGGFQMALEGNVHKALRHQRHHRHQGTASQRKLFLSTPHLTKKHIVIELCKFGGEALLNPGALPFVLLPSFFPPHSLISKISSASSLGPFPTIKMPFWSTLIVTHPICQVKCLNDIKRNRFEVVHSEPVPYGLSYRCLIVC